MGRLDGQQRERGQRHVEDGADDDVRLLVPEVEQRLLLAQLAPLALAGARAAPLLDAVLGLDVRQRAREELDEAEEHADAARVEQDGVAVPGRHAVRVVVVALLRDVVGEEPPHEAEVGRREEDAQRPREGERFALGKKTWTRLSATASA